MSSFVFSGKIPCLHLTASAKAPRAASWDPGSPGVRREHWARGVRGMLLHRGLGQHLGTVFPRRVSQTEGLPHLLELSVSPLACGSNIPCGALLCAVASLPLITTAVPLLLEFSILNEFIPGSSLGAAGALSLAAQVGFDQV